MNSADKLSMPVLSKTFQRPDNDGIDEAVNEFIAQSTTDYSYPIIQNQCITENNRHITLNILYKIVPKEKPSPSINYEIKND